MDEKYKRDKGCEEDLEECLKKKLFKLILLLQNPKEEILEVLPIVVGKAIHLAFTDKINETLESLIIRSDIPASKQYSPETQICTFVFNKLNGGSTLGESAIGKLMSRFIDPIKPIERNLLIIRELSRFVDKKQTI